MSLTDERKELEKNKDNLKAARTAINNKFIELGGAASTSFNDVPEKTTELANTITATNKIYIDNKTGDLNSLQTNKKDNLVNAINEIITELNTLKSEINGQATRLSGINDELAIEIGNPT